jgi:hypothetical protein
MKRAWDVEKTQRQELKDFKKKEKEYAAQS